MNHRLEIDETNLLREMKIVNDKREQHGTCGDKTRIVIAGSYHELCRGLMRFISEEAKLGVCIEADNANQTLDAIRKQEVDLVMVDISLRDADGIQLVEKIKTQCPGIPVIILSMSNEAIYVKHTTHVGARQIIVNKKMTEQITKALRYAQNLLENRIYGFNILVKAGGDTQT